MLVCIGSSGCICSIDFEFASARYRKVLNNRCKLAYVWEESLECFVVPRSRAWLLKAAIHLRKSMANVKSGIQEAQDRDSSASDSSSTSEEERLKRLFNSCDADGDGYLDGLVSIVSFSLDYFSTCSHTTHMHYVLHYYY